MFAWGKYGRQEQDAVGGSLSASTRAWGTETPGARTLPSKTVEDLTGQILVNAFVAGSCGTDREALQFAEPTKRSGVSASRIDVRLRDECLMEGKRRRKKRVRATKHSWRYICFQHSVLSHGGHDNSGF